MVDAENSKLFEALTEAADSLMTSGFENIYENPRESIQASIAE